MEANVNSSVTELTQKFAIKCQQTPKAFIPNLMQSGKHNEPNMPNSECNKIQ